jgi:hypothetical protein
MVTINIVTILHNPSTATVAGTDNNQLKAAAEEIVVVVTATEMAAVTATATTININNH